MDPTIVEERFSDRLMIIPFKTMACTNSTDMQNKSNSYNQYISQEAKPLEFIISEMGDFIRSLEFMEHRASFTEEMSLKAMVIKDRTIRNNYATGYTVSFLVV